MKFKLYTWYQLILFLNHTHLKYVMVSHYIYIYIYVCVCVCVCVCVRTQPLLNGPGIGLGSQLTCRVGLVFPTKGSSSPSVPMTPFSSSEHPYFPLCVALCLGIASSLFSLSPYFLFKIANPLFSFHSLIYSLRWVEAL